jgi:hypothetical protein
MATITDRKDEAMHTIELSLSSIHLIREGLHIAAEAPSAALDMPAAKAKALIADAFGATRERYANGYVALTDDEVTTIHRATTYAMIETGEKDLAYVAFDVLRQVEGIGA